MRTLAHSILSSIVLAIVAIGCSGDDSSAVNPPVDAGGGKDSGNPTPDAGGGGDAATQKDIVDTAVAAGQFKTLVAAVQAAGLESTLRSKGPFTVFAPTDDAFAKVPSFLTAQLVTAPYKTELGLILKYHVLSGEVKAADVLNKQQSVASVEGGKLAVDGSNGKVVINGSVNVTTPDVLASNGVIHVIDGVLLPTIVDTAVGYDDGTNKFSTLVTAVTMAGLADTLSKAGTYTVFAPTDAAFAALKTAIGDTAFNAILADNAKLTKILTYHVLASQAFAKDVTNGDVTTVEGDKLTLAVGSGKVTVTDSTGMPANVILADLPNSNGVIHAIDKVLLPPGL